MSYKAGEKIFIKLNNGSVICQSENGLEVSHEGILVRCKTNAPWGTIIEGGQSSGSMSITGAYRSDATAPTSYSQFELIQELGKIHEAVFGGLEPGDQVLTVNVQITNVSITADQSTEMTFTATLTFAGAPVVSVLTT